MRVARDERTQRRDQAAQRVGRAFAAPAADQQAVDMQQQWQSAFSRRRRIRPHHAASRARRCISAAQYARKRGGSVEALAVGLGGGGLCTAVVAWARARLGAQEPKP